MAASLLLACGLNEQKLPSAIHLSEESDIDGSFLISSILGQRLRIQNSGVILICLQQNYQHYMNAGIRLGYNLNMFNGKNLYVHEPILDIIKSNFCENSTAPSSEINDSIFSDEIFKFIEKIIKEKFIEKTSITIILDNLSILMNMGESYRSILKFYENLKEFIENIMNESTKSITLLTKLNNCDLFNVLDNNLIRMSDLHIRVVKLKSGAFKEVDGKLIITKDEIIEFCQINKNEKNILYKVNDKNIKIFNPGEVGIKI
ncbi:elongator complex protein 6 [Condylostylus longicornis]|uniref:elongator complex protein 6 n=1 Tax=Condylostylus longicornis TaxID=2530218 RepID=UPI00244E2AB3|nr:elongator complex protein 6 [Condylostylus longicornis]XP_055379537.1 elongator complex protein 6 [Condylostylus longicornis]